MSTAPLVPVGEWENYSKTPAPANAATLLAAASDAIRGVCGWSVSYESVEHELYDSWGTTLFNLPTLRLKTVDYLAVEWPGDDMPTNMIEREDFIWSKRGAFRLLKGRTWPWSYQCVDMSFTHGYTNEEMPDSIKMLCVSISKRVDAAPAGVLAEAVGGTNIQYGESNSKIALSDLETSVLGPFILEPGRSR
jgi:hypothetical protein